AGAPCGASRARALAPGGRERFRLDFLTRPTDNRPRMSGVRGPVNLLELLAAGESDTALLEPDAGRRVSYGELREEVRELAGKLAGAGVVRGDTVALVVPNGPHFVRFLLATTALGAAAAPLNPAYTTEEFRFYLE